jgi:excisionase family DNA binding protein
MDNESEILLTIEEAGRRLSVGRSVMYQLIKNGSVQSCIIGKSRRIPVSSLQAFIEERMSDSNETVVKPLAWQDRAEEALTKLEHHRGK